MYSTTFFNGFSDFKMLDLVIIVQDSSGTKTNRINAPVEIIKLQFTELAKQISRVSGPARVRLVQGTEIDMSQFNEPNRLSDQWIEFSNYAWKE